MKKSSKRKYAPKIIQHLILSFSSIIVTILLILIIFQIWDKNTKNEAIDFFSVINDNSIKVMVILLIANYGIAIYCSIIIIFLQKKTDDGRIFVIFEIVFALLLITSIFSFVFSILALKNNELVYE